MSNYNKITALYSRLSVGDEDRDGGESNSIQNQKIFLENYAKGQHLTNIRHYIDDDESGRFFDRSAYSRMIGLLFFGNTTIPFVDRFPQKSWLPGPWRRRAG